MTKEDQLRASSQRTHRESTSCLQLLVDRIGSRHPTPAGGSAAAAAIAQGTALLLKAVRIGAAPRAVLELGSLLGSLATRATELFESDSTAFDDLLEARAREDLDRLALARMAVTRVPLELADTGVEALSTVAEVRRRAKRSLQPDVDAGLELIDTGIAISLTNARVNLQYVTNAAAHEMLEARLDETVERAQRARTIASTARSRSRDGQGNQQCHLQRVQDLMAPDE